jgi:hypothetical protein
MNKFVDNYGKMLLTADKALLTNENAEYLALLENALRVN